MIVKTLNIQKTNIVEKGLGTILIGHQFDSAIRRYFKGIKFDLILYYTPPITLYGVVKRIKKRQHAKAYLLLKDIFPQNSIDVGLLKKSGLTSFIYRYFKRKEQKLYSVSDCIGCMSQANADYILRNNPDIDSRKIEIFPNCLEQRDCRVDEKEKTKLRTFFGFPDDKIVFVYGGNIGRPQGVKFIEECLKKEKDNDSVLFLIVGDGTEYNRLQTFLLDNCIGNVRLMKKINNQEYSKLLGACDIGLIFLDYRFTIPNYPSRLLSYMEAGLPVLAATDNATDIGKNIVDGDFGWWCESNDCVEFSKKIETICKNDLRQKSINSYKYYVEHFTVEKHYKKVLK